MHGTPDELQYKITVSFERLPEEAWEPEAITALVNKLGGELIHIRSKDKRELVVDAWFLNPSKVSKVLELEITKPKPAMWSKFPSSDDKCESPPPPVSLTSRRTLVHTVNVHVTSVVDHGELMACRTSTSLMKANASVVSTCSSVGAGGLTAPNLEAVTTTLVD
jgi:hypothetical protein